MITGNKGEWSEIYVLIYLLAHGKLKQADINLNEDPKNTYHVLKAYKSELNYDIVFSRKEEILVEKLENVVTDKIKIPIQDFIQFSNKLYEKIKSASGRSFQLPGTEFFFKQIFIQKLKAESSSKADITLRIYDDRLAKETDLGFSIKSLIGGDSTLLNTGPGNNFTFFNSKKPTTPTHTFNAVTYKPPKGLSKITARLQRLEEENIFLKFHEIQSDILWRNLKMIDGDLPKIIGYALYYRYLYRKRFLSEVVEILEDKDPLNFYNGIPSAQKFYEYKIKRLLTESAMGMTSETPWHGEYDSFGGVIVAKEDGNVVCFHIYDFNIFRKYLINNTYFEQASTGEDPTFPGHPKAKGKKYYYGWLYEENGGSMLKINLQIRLKS